MSPLACWAVTQGDLSAVQPQLDCNQGLGFGCENKCSLHSYFQLLQKIFIPHLRTCLDLSSKADSSPKSTRGCGGEELGNKWNSVIVLMPCIVLIKLFGCSQTNASVRLIYRSRLLPVWNQEVKPSTKILDGVIFKKILMQIVKNLIENTMCSWLGHLQAKILLREQPSGCLGVRIHLKRKETGWD